MINDVEKKEDKKIDGAEIAGNISGNVHAADKIYDQEKFHARQGHGFAAEQANTMYDKLTGHEAKTIGDDFAKDGADRIVDGIRIQSKYCSSGSKCIAECFNEDGFRYRNPDGSPMQIEVPSDKYEAAVQAMEDRIKKGEVPGVTDPAQAKKIVRKGHFTYLQAKNIAKAGTVESLAFDSINGVIVAGSSFGISTVLSFATSVWNGNDIKVSLKNATHTGLKVGGTTFVTTVLASQLTKAGLNSVMVKGSEAVVKSVLGTKGAHLLAQAAGKGAAFGGAAIKSAAKVLRSNVITSVASVVVLSSGDVINIFRGRISGKQLAKNVTTTTASVAGGVGGWMGGAAAGATAGAALGSFVPIIGTAIGGTVGGFIGGLAGSFAGGTVAGKVTGAVLDEFIEDDANLMIKIIQDEFVLIADEYILTEKEANTIVEKLGVVLSGKVLKDMYAANDRKYFARCILEPLAEAETKKRPMISLPSDEEMQMSLKEVLEDLYDAEEKREKENKPRSEEEKSEYEKWGLAMIALCSYFARCDGSVSSEEEDMIEEIFTTFFEDDDVSEKTKVELETIKSNEKLTFFRVRKYLDVLPVEVLEKVREKIDEIIMANGIASDEEIEEKEKFISYFEERKKKEMLLKVLPMTNAIT